MRDGAHFRKPDDNAVPRRKRPWWLFELAVPVAVALVVTIVVLVQVTGHPSSRRGQPRQSAIVLTPAAAGSPVPSPSGDAGAAAPATTATSATTAPGSRAPGSTAPGSTAPGSTAAPATSPANPPYLLPDGAALPVLIVFDGSTINLSGAVPTGAAGQRLATLAHAYSKTPNAHVVSNLVVDPRVPVSTGVRVVEMNAARFGTGSSQITPDYAPELSRVVTLLKAMPNLTALVVGHADQRGDVAVNLALSEARATAVVEYLSSQGVNADRLSAQGVGDESPLTRQSDAAGLALNRRTEFVFYGLLAGA